jgi:hypothetical protein
MKDNITVGDYTFKYNNENNFYECRGMICYDNEHDEMPEPRLWQAAHKLQKQLQDEGISSSVEYSEKGWVEVYL